MLPAATVTITVNEDMTPALSSPTLTSLTDATAAVFGNPVTTGWNAAESVVPIDVLAPGLDLSSPDLGGKTPADGPGWNAYLAISGMWSVLILIGVLEIWRKRHCKAILIRGSGFILAAVLIIHCYLVVCVIEYFVRDRVGCAVRFWLVSLHLPAAIAAFQGKVREQ